MPGEIVYHIDMGEFVSETANQTAQKTAAFVRRAARAFVRKDTQALENSIRTNKIGPGHFETLAGGTDAVPYALAQEYGRPDLPNYGFTPYMRPAAELTERDASTRRSVVEAVEEASKKALKKRRVKIP